MVKTTAPIRVLQSHLKETRERIARAKKTMKENKANDLHVISSLKRERLQTKRRLAKLRKELRKKGKKKKRKK